MTTGELSTEETGRGPVLRAPFDETLIGVLLVLFVLFAWITVEALRFPAPMERVDVGAGRFPLIAGLGGMVSCLGTFYFAVRHRARCRLDSAGQRNDGMHENAVEIRRPLSILVAALLILAWVEGMLMIGFYTCSLFLVPAILLLGGERRPYWIVLFTVGFLIAIYGCFSLLLHIEFP